jgi:hypothetical protein
MAAVAVAARVTVAQSSAMAGAGDSFSLNAVAAQTPESNPLMRPPDEAEPRLLQEWMTKERMGGDFMDQYGLRIGGHAAVGYTFNFNEPADDSNGRHRLFDDKHMDPTLHQIGLWIERAVPASADRFDTGFRAEIFYGADARYTQANGTNFYGSRYAGQQSITVFPNSGGAIDEIGFPGQPDPNNQLDLLQLYVTFNLPVGNGLLVRAGKFVTPWGIEKIDPTENLLYSHSLIFSVSTPKTLTGVTATYQLDEYWGFSAGIVTGWDQSIEDNNDFPSFLGQVMYEPNEEWSFVLSGIMGPEREDEESDWRFMLDLTAEHRMSEDVTLGFEGVIGFEPNAGTEWIDSILGQPPNQFLDDFLFVTEEDAIWVAGAAYLKYQLDPEGVWTLNLRGEYFNDAYGARLLATEVYSGSAGLTIVPFAQDDIGRNFMIRPEVRWDYALDEIFDGNSKVGQITLGADLVFKF